MKIFFLISLFSVVSFSALAENQLQNCTVAGLKKVRNQISVAKNTFELIAVDEEVSRTCPFALVNPKKIKEALVAEFFNFKSELISAYYRVNGFSKCLSEGVALRKRYYHNSFVELRIDKRPIGKKIEKSIELCEAARLKGLVKMKSNQLPDGTFIHYRDFSGASDYVGILETPKAIAESGSGVFLRQEKKIERLEANKGVAKEKDFCSQLAPTLYKKNSNSYFLRLTGVASACGSRAGSSQVDALYEIKNKRLALVDEIVVPLQ